MSFQERFVPELDRRQVVEIARESGIFRVRLESDGKLRPKTLLPISRDSYPVHYGCRPRSSLSHAHAIAVFPEPALSSSRLLGQVRAGADLISILGSKTCCGPSTRNHP
jgi:hypothetical protein